MRRWLLTQALGLSLAASACAPAYAPGYQDALAAGLRARNAGRSEEARDAFMRAAGLADRYKDREAARFLAGETLEELGDVAAALAVYEQIVKDADGRHHGARAAFAVARLTMERDGFEAGERAVLAAIRLYADSGLVRHAVRRLLEVVESERGPTAALEWLTPLEAELRATQAGEAVTYEWATLLARADRKAESIDALLALARSKPYPQGSMTDDAYFVASLQLEDLDRVDEAIEVLREMRAPEEAAYAGSSYDRPRWPAGSYRIAVLLRDRKQDLDGALAAFREVLERHPDSRVADDALFEIARLEAGRGGAERACDAARAILAREPESKYVRCVHHVCPAAPKGARPCSSDALRTLGLDPDTVWATHE
jgi:tetratricopeptide (TPR) repeat protein